MERIGTIIHKDGYRISLFRKGDAFIRQETLPTETDRESGKIYYSHSRQDEISRSAIVQYCLEYFNRMPENCWCELWARN